MPFGFEIRDDLSTEQLAVMWSDLEQRSDASFFQSWQWIGCWIAEAGLRPVTLVGRAEGRVVLLGVLVPTDRRDVLPFAIHGLHLHTTGDIDRDIITIEYNGFLADRDYAGAATAALRYLLTGVAVGARRRDELHLKGMATTLDLPGIGGEAICTELSRQPSWRVDIEAVRAAGTGYLDSLSANTRQQIRRAMRLYEKRGPLTATRARDQGEALAFLDELKTLHQRYWTGRGEPGAFSYPFFERFQRRMIETGLDSGAVEIIRVAAGAHVIGYVYNFVYRGTALAYQTGIAYEDDAKLKPGLVSHALCIDLHLREGGRVYDFMAGAARYKASLGKPGPDMVYYLLERPTLPLRIESVLRTLKHRLFGARPVRAATPQVAEPD